MVHSQSSMSLSYNTNYNLISNLYSDHNLGSFQVFVVQNGNLFFYNIYIQNISLVVIQKSFANNDPFRHLLGHLTQPSVNCHEFTHTGKQM
jgi:hypothetical protein